MSKTRSKSKSKPHVFDPNKRYWKICGNSLYCKVGDAIFLYIGPEFTNFQAQGKVVANTPIPHNFLEDSNFKLVHPKDIKV